MNRLDSVPRGKVRVFGVPLHVRTASRGHKLLWKLKTAIFWIVYDEATGTTSNGSRLVSLDAYTYIYITMSEQRKAVIKNADMDEKLQQDAVDTASKGLSEYNIEKVLYCLCSCHYYLNRIRSLTHNHHFIYS